MQTNMTSGSVWKGILLFTLPIIGSHMLQSTYTLADSIIVGNFVGANALGAVGMTGALCWIILTFCVGIGTGTSIVVAQYFGAKEEDAVGFSISAAYLIALLSGVALTLLFFLSAKAVIWGFLAAPPEMRAESLLYFRIYCGGIVFQLLYNVTYGILRAHGDSRGALLFLLTAAVLNITLDLLFVVRLGWGVAGAALATVLSQMGCAAICIVYMIRLFPHRKPRLRFDRETAEKSRTILHISLPIIAQSAVSEIGFTVLQRLVNSFGPASIQGYSAMCRVEDMAHIPSRSFSASVSAFTAQNIGAKQPERAVEGYRCSLLMGGALTVLLSVVITLNATPLLSLFNIEGEALRRGREHLILLMCFMVVLTVISVTSGFLQGAGDVRVPALAGFVNLSIRLALSFAMAPTFIDFRSIYVSMPPAWIVCCLIVVLRYRSGAWKRHGLV